MARRRRRNSRGRRFPKLLLSLAAVVLVLLIGLIAAQILEESMSVKVENAGEQLTAHSKEENTAQVYVNGQWYERREVETLLVMGVDDFGAITSSGSYNNTRQTDFLALLVHEPSTGKNAAIHLNRDTMTDITVLGVTGENAGTRYAQLALAFNYGRGENDSCRNTAGAVSRLLYGIKTDHYIAVTMDAIPLLNDWVGGVEVEVEDDFSSIAPELVQGEKVRLQGDLALTYVRTRAGLEDSSNLSRMNRQRQYAALWLDAAKAQLDNTEAIGELVMQMGDCHYTDFTIEQIAKFAEKFSDSEYISVYELPGEAVKGDEFMEYYVDDEKVQEVVLKLFYKPVTR